MLSTCLYINGCRGFIQDKNVRLSKESSKRNEPDTECYLAKQINCLCPTLKFSPPDLHQPVNQNYLVKQGSPTFLAELRYTLSKMHCPMLSIILHQYELDQEPNFLSMTLQTGQGLVE
jgi:hypothetical protein